MSVLGDNIARIRVLRGLTQRDLAEKMGVTKQTISNYEHDRRTPDADDVRNLAALLMVPPSALYDERSTQDIVAGDAVARKAAEEAQESIKKTLGAIPYERLPVVRVLGTVRCGPGGLAVEDFQGWETADVPNPEEYFYLRCTGDSMAPRIQEGDLALVHQQDDVDSGELAVVVLDGEEGMLKKVIKQNGTVVLQSLNPAYQPIILAGEALDGVKVVGRVKRVVSAW